jgi:hypothetical protein
MDERDLCALYLFRALCAVSTQRDKWVSQSVYERNTKNVPEQIEIETSSFLVVAVNVIHFRFVLSFWVWGPINRPAFSSR